MLAMPVLMFLDPLALTIFLAFASSPSNSAAVGATPAAGTASAAPGAAAGLPSAPSPGAAAFFARGAFASLVSAAGFASAAGAAAPSAASFLGAFFGFVSSAMGISLNFKIYCLVNAGLGVRVALHADRLARSFACAGV